jgi:hypothetical protein
MSEGDRIMAELDTPDRIIGELKGCSQRLNEIRGELLQLRQIVLGAKLKGVAFDRDGLAVQFGTFTNLAACLKPVALDLARATSQVLEHQRLDVMDRVVLRWHLAECECALFALDSTLDLCRRTLPPEVQRKG